MLVAAHIIDTPDAGPEFIVSDPLQRERSLLAGVGMPPIVGDDRPCGVRRVLKHVVLSVRFALNDSGYLSAYRNHRCAESVQLFPGFAFGRFDHQRVGDRNETVGA